MLHNIIINLSLKHLLVFVTSAKVVVTVTVHLHYRPGIIIPSVGEIVEEEFCELVVRVPSYRSRGPRFHSQHYQIFWEVVGLEWGPLNLVSTTEELFGRKCSGSGLENWEYGQRDPLC
jgi:hypothetical protein